MNRPLAHLLAPRHWPAWLMIGCMWCLAQMPFRVQMAAGRLFGALMPVFAHDRVQIVRTNLDLCFRELPTEARDRLQRAHFRSLGMALVETAAAWFAPERRLEGLTHFEGYEHLEAALAQGKGVILLSAHFNSLEIGGRLLARRLPLHVMYRPDKSPVVEYFMGRSRERRYGRAIRRDNVRGMLRSLKEGHAVWYASDLNFRGSNRVFAPFFGIPAATNSALARIAAVSESPVVPFFTTQREEGDGYLLHFGPPLEDFPSGDAEADATRVNALIETAVRRTPAQYLWMLQRFKSRPPGEPRLYPVRPKRGRGGRAGRDHR